MNEWNIQNRAHRCQVCQKAFADKAPYHTVLFEEKQQYLREDICGDCWAGPFSEGVSDRKGFISHWQGIYQAPPPVPPEPIRRETAEGLLRKLLQANDATHGAACYILAAMLERKRVLKVKEQLFRQGARVFIYEQPASGDIFTITDPNLRLNQLEEVRKDIVQLLNQGQNPPAAEVPGGAAICPAPDQGGGAAGGPATEEAVAGPASVCQPTGAGE